MTAAVFVFFGAGLGGLFRHCANLLGVRLVGFWHFPITTLVVNVLGCFIMGAFTAWFVSPAGMGIPQHVRVFLTTGMLGGFTTYSTFSLEFAVLVERGEPMHALLYAGGTLVLCLLGVFAGLLLVRSLV
ncbi:MAG: fluoride efflux transporter CrcB [Pseudomonadota bacterium]